MKNVLVISNRILSETDNNGKTLLNMIRRFPAQKISQLYFYGSTPEVGGYRYFQISTKDIIKGKWNKRFRGRPVCPIGYCGNSDNNTPVTKKYGIKRTAILLLIRDLLWRKSWISDQLIEWLNRIKPEVIFFLAGDALFAYEISLWIKKQYNCDLYTYVTDDYVLERDNENIFEKKQRLLIYKALKECSSESSVFFTICERMQKMYKEVLGVDSSILFNRCNSLYDSKLNNKMHRNQSIVFMYAGSLYYGRDKVIIQLAKVLKRINDERKDEEKSAVLYIYLNAEPNDSFLRELKETEVAYYKGRLNAEELKIKLNICTYPVFVESFDNQEIEKVRLSFSTKVPEYLSLRKEILAIGPHNIGSMDSMSKAAFCINSYDEIYPGVRRMLNNPQEAELYGEKAKKMYDKLMSYPGLEEYVL